MTLATRVIATLLVSRDRLLVKGRSFAADRVIGDPIQYARVMANTREIDELVVLDVHATVDGREPNYSLIAQIAETCRVPLAYGGGVSSVDVAARVIGTGADKVVIGSWTRAKLDAACDISERFGAQAVVMSFDWPGHETHTLHSRMPDGVYLFQVANRWAGELLCQVIERDGTLGGYDLHVIREVSRRVSLPVIASGGCSGPKDAVAAMKAGASAVAAGALYAFTDTTPLDVKRALAEAGYPVRISATEAMRV